MASCSADTTLDTFSGILAQIPTNALNNAVDHGFRERQRGRITVAPGVARLIVEVARYGNGIELAHRGRALFTTAQARGGTGLGLRIVHNLVVNPLEGSVAVHSRAGDGTRLRLDLPRLLS